MRYDVGEAVVVLVDGMKYKTNDVAEVLRTAPGCQCTSGFYDIGDPPQLFRSAVYCRGCGTSFPASFANECTWYMDQTLAPLLTDEQQADFEDAIREPEYATL